MNDAIGMKEVSTSSEGGQSDDAPKVKRGEVSKAIRLAFVAREAVKDQKLGPTSIMKLMAKKYGLGMDYYEIREAMEKARDGEKKSKKKQTRDPVIEAKSKADYLKRERFAKKMLRKLPGLSHVDLNKMAVRKLGREITDTVYKKYSVKAEKPKDFKAKVVGGVKAGLKSGTLPLKAEQHRLGKLFVECDVKEATFTIVDGVPRWRTVRHVVEES